MSRALRHGVLALTAVATAVSLLALYWSWTGRLQELPDAATTRFDCVSYAPFRGDETPFDPAFVAPADRIAADLKALADVSGCVRTYSVGQGLDAVLPAARAAGLDVLLGIWIGRDAIANEREVVHAIELVQAYPESIRAVIVGNEVLLRREQSPDALGVILDRVRRNVTVPVTYADVWEFWLQNPALASHVDFVTVHILPYWEDDPVGVADAIAHVGTVFDRVRAAYPGMAILVGETGWPSAGRIRGAAEPGRVAQARYIREFIDYAAGNGVQYNLVEAFDQPWKRALEGTVGGHWGIVDPSGALKFPLAGPAREIDGPWRWFAGSAVAALMLIAVAFAGNAGRIRRLRFGVGTGAAAALATIALSHQLGRIGDTARTAGEWVVEIGLLMLAVAMAVVFARILPIAGAATAPVRSARQMLQAPGTKPIDWFRIAATAAYLFVSICLIADPRYRDLPTASFAIPALGFMLLAWITGDGRVTRETGDRLLGVLSLACGAAVLLREWLGNPAGWGWAALGVAFAIGWWAMPADQRAGGSEARTSPNSTSSSPTAPVSTL